MAAPVYVVTLAEALPNYVEEVRQVPTQLADLCRQEEGCLRFDIYTDSARPHLFDTIEQWQTAELHKRHTTSSHVAKTVTALIGKLRAATAIRVLNAVSELEA